MRHSIYLYSFECRLNVYAVLLSSSNALRRERKFKHNGDLLSVIGHTGAANGEFILIYSEDIR